LGICGKREVPEAGKEGEAGIVGVEGNVEICGVFDWLNGNQWNGSGREREVISLFYLSDCEPCAVALFGLLQSQVSIWGISFLSPPSLSILFSLVYDIF
jgi:hypothetical protein